MILFTEDYMMQPPKARVGDVSTGQVFLREHVDLCMRISDDPLTPDLVRMVVLQSPTLAQGGVLISNPNNEVELVMIEASLCDYPETVHEG